VLDGEWDCSDASDEEVIFNHPLSDQNLKLIKLNILREKFNILYKVMPLSAICNMSIEYPCFRGNMSDSLGNFTQSRLCIGLHQIGDGHIDCYGGVDERNTVEDCSRSEMLGYTFRCLSSNSCIPYAKLGTYRCPNTYDDRFLFCREHSEVIFSNGKDFPCFNGTCVKNGRCNQIWDCQFGEDEYMCKDELLFGVYYRRFKYLNPAVTTLLLPLREFPKEADTQTYIRKLTVKRRSIITFYPNSMSPSIPYLCNRGVGIHMYNKSIVCFCPPQYYGDKCQFHSDRVAVLVHLNLSQSIYAHESNHLVMLKLRLVFLFKNETLDDHEFDVQPTAEIIRYEKKMIHFLYPRASEFLRYKRQRYFDRANIIDDHPYSLRIEVYEIRDNEEALLVAVWQYPIYFDYLPVFRFAKILHLSKPDIEKNPCSSNLCNRNQQCQQLLNEKTKYICLCKNNFSGENCLVENQLCTNDYCLAKGLCRPVDQSLSKKHKLPSCICPLNRLGRRCEIGRNQCLSNKFDHGGSCLLTTNLAVTICLCKDRYHGSFCEKEKETVYIYINQSVDHAGAIVQDFKIKEPSFSLILVQQKAFKTLPSVLAYHYNENPKSEISLATLYSSHADVEGEVYLILINMISGSINKTNQIIERNRCLDVRKTTPG
jgi:hypothetical protein